jgi:DNA-binding transcriptional ArsR family regulator
VLAVEVIEDPAAAVVALSPVRTRLLAALAEPGSATTLAPPLGLTRQKANYHLRALEAHGLVEVVEERPRRGLRERVLVASAAAYVVSPAALGEVPVDPASSGERLSARYLIALAARAVREVGDLARRAERAGRRLPTLAMDTEVTFRSAAERAAFTRDLADAVTGLVARYHDAGAPGGRPHRLVVVAHPLPRPAPDPVPEEPS